MYYEIAIVFNAVTISSGFTLPHLDYIQCMVIIIIIIIIIIM